MCIRRAFKAGRLCGGFVKGLQENISGGGFLNGGLCRSGVGSSTMRDRCRIAGSHLFYYLSNIGLGDAQKPFNVLNFGAVGDGKTDDSPAFAKAWGSLCGASGGTLALAVPAGHTFLLKPVKFEGPCKSTGIHIQGQQCMIPEKALLFKNSNNLKLSGLSVVNSPRSHVYLRDCKGVSVSGLTITAPGNSPNTDGIDASGSSQVNIVDSTRGTGNFNSSFLTSFITLLLLLLLLLHIGDDVLL
ncbi:hypothetical protein SADUNF_Sadunf06G0203300 [Salix dunnii]|uniref:Pectate lyase superfamily protein domain-containing protein n=1 Tax=Salix dunnii TaxID=1413687 RepID=A0A835K1B3_9ROSI|nr:hypothetical protein SADUNF_Sadunf06G0203300 [Salix dunnii]